MRNFYVFFVPAQFATAYYLDHIYLALFVIVPFSWLFFRGECVISYIAKKMEDPNYVMGSDPANIKDMADLFPNETYYKIFNHLNNLFYAISVFIVNERTLRLSNTTVVAAIMAVFIAREYIPIYYQGISAAEPPKSPEPPVPPRLYNNILSFEKSPEIELGFKENEKETIKL